MADDSQPRYRVDIPKQWLSKGTGETVPTNEIVVYDLMPAIIGERFRLPTLRDNVHIFHDTGLPFIPAIRAFKEFAAYCLNVGNIDLALEAYKHSLHSDLEFATGIQTFQRNGVVVAMTKAEIAQTDPAKALNDLERTLVQTIVSQDVSVDPIAYRTFVQDIRELEVNKRRLSRLFHNGGATQPYEDKSKKGDRETGLALRSVYEAMHRYSDAVFISKLLGEPDWRPTETKRDPNSAIQQLKTNQVFPRIVDRIHNQTFQ